MLDFGWQEFLLIAVVTVLIVGPKELPRVFRTITGIMRKARSLAGEFHSAMDEMAREAELDDIKKEAQKLKSGSSDWVKEMDPTGEVSESISDIKGQVSEAREKVNKDVKTTGKGVTESFPGTFTTPTPVIRKDRPAEEAVSSAKAEPQKPASQKTNTKKTAVRKATGKKAITKKAGAKKAAVRKTVSVRESDA